ncbi:MAG: ABC transporter ATP-binding protein [Bdellovibrionales bacterium]|nr:ABC transporter ATP-binding protein [Bdellovibrionales bacterium]
MQSSILSIRDLKVEFSTYGGTVQAVRGVSLEVSAGETLAVVGESGCGKSVTMQSIMGLIPTPPGKITGGSAKLLGRELIGTSVAELNRVRGRDVGMIFQDPMTSLNPTMTIGDQIAETLIVHRALNYEEARKRAIKLLELVQIPEPHLRVDSYPFQYSGGMRQRVMIAMALACEPKVLIADEPTTALDVTIQAQILNLLKDIQVRTGMALIIVTHDLGVVARMADRVAVMYAGQIVEKGTVDQIFYQSSHPYTVGLKTALPTRGEKKHKLVPIQGAPPDLFNPPVGCAYAARCPYAMKICGAKKPVTLRSPLGHQVSCWLNHPHVAESNREERVHV